MKKKSMSKFVTTLVLVLVIAISAVIVHLIIGMFILDSDSDGIVDAFDRDNVIVVDDSINDEMDEKVQPIIRRGNDEEEEDEEDVEEEEDEDEDGDNVDLCADVNCDDNVTCTMDSCSKGDCSNVVNNSLCSGGNICHSTIGCTECLVNSDCDDNVSCTRDKCISGVCNFEKRDSMCTDRQTCGVSGCEGSYCGDGRCDSVENSTICAVDCVVVSPSCGDGTCNGAETCNSCSADCGSCVINGGGDEEDDEEDDEDDEEDDVSGSPEVGENSFWKWLKKLFGY